MKNKIIALLFILSCMSMAKAETYTMDIANNETKNWDDPAAWNEGVVPSINDDVIISGYGGAGTPEWVYLEGGSVYNAKNLTLSNHASISTVGSKNPWVGPSLNVAENFTVQGAGTVYFVNAGSYQGGYAFKNITVGGNFVLENPETHLAFSKSESITYSPENLSLSVGGVLDVKSGFLAINRGGNVYVNDINVYAKIGGLVGTNAVLANRENCARSTYLIFGNQDGKVFTGGTFSGALSENVPGDTMFTIEMNDTSLGGNKQTLILQDTTKSGYSNFDNLHVNVKSGRMDISTASGVTLTTLNLDGGIFGVAASDSGVSTGIAKVSGDLTWYSQAKIEFTVNIDTSNYDVLEVNNLIFADSASDATYEFIFDMLGNFDETTAMHFNILTLAEGNSFDSDILNKLVGKTSDGLYLATFSLNEGNNKLYLDGFSQIPEPAEVAAFFGAAALAFAAWRRRK